MFKNHITLAWRNLTRGKSFSVINLLGLAIGMGGACLILLWIHHEMSYDKFHNKADRIYEVYGLATVDGKLFTINQTSQPLAPALKEEYPEVELSARFASINSFLITAGNQRMTGINGSFVDPSFLKMFSFEQASGNPELRLENSNSIVITEKLARKLFGTVNAVNEIIRIDSGDNFIVTAVLKDIPSNSRFDFEYLLPWSYLRKLGWNDESWLSNNITSFLLLKRGADFSAVESKIKNITREKSGNAKVWTHFLHPLNQWHLYSKFENGIATGGRIETVRLLAAIAAFILLIACINFMNLSTARSEKRGKEIGIRKVAGAGKTVLVRQFIIESILMAFISGLVALLLVSLALPHFNTLVEAQLVIPFKNIFFWFAASGFIIITGLLAGSYPAFYLASFKPSDIFRSKFRNPLGLISPRKVLVVLQFSFAVILIISTMVVRQQINYAQQRELGYIANNLVHVDFKGEIKKNYLAIKNELLKNGIATSVTKTMTTITRKGSNTWGLRWPGRDPNGDETIGLTSADADLIKTTGIKLIAGRDIDIYNYPGDSTSVLLNETAVKLMGFKDPIGQMISQPSATIEWRVVGVVKDYILNSPYEKIPPMVIQGPKSFFTTMHIKFNSSNSTAENLAMTERVFRKFNPAYPFDFKFVDEEYASAFDNEQRTKALAGLFAILSITISCLGLFGLSTYIAQSRIKEVGVRKVLGASTLSIARLLSVDFIRLIVISILIGSPVAWWLMNYWLRDYSYRTAIGWEVFVFAALVAILIAMLTISFQSIKAALSNPVKSLRTE